MSDVQIWHDETERWKQTGRLDQGPCWCAECVQAELDNPTTHPGSATAMEEI